MSVNECRAWNPKGVGSASEARKLFILVSKKGYVNSTFLISCYRVLLSRHNVRKRIVVVLARTDRVDGLTGSMIIHVTRWTVSRMG